MIVFFESYSILQIFFLIGKIRRAEKIIFHSGSSPFSFYLANILPGKTYRGLVKAVVKKINSTAVLEEVNQEQTNAFNWTANFESPELIDKMTGQICQTTSFRILEKLLGSPHLIKYYQHFLAQGYIANTLSFLNMAEAQKGQPQYLVPYDIDMFDAITRMRPVQEGCYISNGSLFAGRILSLYKRLKYWIIFLNVPIFMIFRAFLKNGAAFKSPEKMKCRMSQRLINGFSEKRKNDGAAFLTDDFLLPDSFDASDIVFIFDRPIYPEGMRQTSTHFLNKHGIRYIDFLKLKITPEAIKSALTIQMFLMKSFFSGILGEKDSFIFHYIGIMGINRLLKKSLEEEYLQPEVEFCRSDGNSGHIINTIMVNKRGGTTIGLQHNSTAGPYIWPQLCFVHYNRYCIYSRAHKRLHAPFWERIQTEPVGSLGVDSVIRLARDKQRVKEIRQRMHTLYRKSRFTVLINFPNPMAYSLSGCWREMTDALNLFDTTEVNIFLRFRNKDHLSHAMVRPLTELAEKKSGIIIDHENFTTHELLIASNLFISSSSSSGLIEAAVIGINSFTLDYMGTGHLCFSRFGKNLVLSSRDDILNALNGLYDDFRAFDCDWQRLAQAYNYVNDGTSLNRLKHVVWAE